MMKEEEPTAAVPEASPELNEKEEAKTAPASRRNVYLLLGGLAFVIVAVLCIALPLALIKDNDDNSKDADMILVVDNEDAQSTNNEATARLVDGTLPLFGKSLLEGYERPDQLKGALTIAFRQQAQTIIEQNVENYERQKEWQTHYGGYNDDGAGGPPPTAAGGAMPMMEEAEGDSMAMADNAAAPSGGAAGASSEGGVTDFETNNQEENVDEADVIKADANFIYGAYGDYIVIWDPAGNQVAQVKMPPIDVPQKPQEESPLTKPEVASSTKKSMIAPPDMYQPKARINSMLLTDNHLVALVSGYNDYWWGPYNEQPRRMLHGFRALQARVYEKTPSGDLNFVTSADINGNFVDARSIGDVVHLATSSSVDTWSHLGRPLDWWQIANGTDMTVEEYRRLATQKADEVVVTAVDMLIKELRSFDGELPTLLQINQWFTQTNDTSTNAGRPGIGVPYHHTYDVVSNLAQVTSFNVNTAAQNGALTTTASAYLAPSYFDTLYGSETNLVLATSGWDWNPIRGQGEQTTYLVALDINDDDTTSFRSVGTLKGHLLNQYALDIVDDELRAATTVERFQWWWGPPMPFMDTVDSPAVMEEPMVEEVVREGGGRRRLNKCPTQEEDGCVNDDNYAECVALLDEGCEDLAILESCPLQFRCEDQARQDNAADEPAADSLPIDPQPPRPQDESRTENYMVVLNLEAGQMSEKGRVQIGEKNERITSVRFFDNVAYAVTFERTDPFYVLDMSVPKVLGELKIPGFSSYLHSMNDDNTLLLAVGQNATDEGRETGLMVTVFDATDPSDPKQLVTHVFGTDGNGHSSSSVRWDYKAFRYVDGKLVVPLEIWYYQEWDPVAQQLVPLPEGAENFRGFAVLDVSETAITEQYRVSHLKPEGTCVYCDGWLPQRSFVYNGDLMTIQENLVVSTGLHSGEEKWRFSLEVPESMGCCW